MSLLLPVFMVVFLSVFESAWVSLEKNEHFGESATNIAYIECEITKRCARFDSHSAYGVCMHTAEMASRQIEIHNNFE